jgi:tripartite-type tricarboxylate transporter receptor subunit TctC
VSANTPRDVMMTIQQETRKVLAMPDVLERIKAFGADPVGSTPEEFAAKFKADMARFARIVEDAKLPKQD